jgi:glycosyltransferase involved in cell wall biosynthesis
MKLLILTNNPNRASFKQRVEVYLSKLQEGGVFAEVIKLPTSELERLKVFKRASQFDGVLLQKKRLNLFDAVCLRRYGRKIIYDFDDAVMYSDKSPERNRSSHFRLFRRTAKLADMVIAGNLYLAEHARRFNPNVEILPTGLNTSNYKLCPKLKNDGRIRLVWIGSSSTLKYLAEIKPALEEIGARFDNVVLRIIADDFFDLQNMEVEEFRWSLEKQAADLATSDVGLAPLPNNRFTKGKCGFKILQYAAAGLAVVASAVGINAEYVCDGVTGFHAINASQWIDKISELIENAELRRTMGREGQANVKNFDIDVIGKRLLDLIVGAL